MFFCLSAFSQDEFAPGFIVKNNRDTIRGVIRNTIEEDLEKEIDFKLNQNGTIEIFRPGDIESFGVEEDIFRSISYLNTSLDSPAASTDFAKQLVLGKYELYTFQKKERRFYIVRSGDHTQLLFDTQYTNYGDVVQEGNYNSRLRLILNECPKVSLNYRTLEYGQKQMTDYIERLDHCLAPASVKIYYHKAKTLANLYVYAGGLPVPSKNQICAEIGMRFSSPSFSRKTVMNIALHYTYVEDAWERHDVNYSYIVYKTTTKDQMFSLPVTIQYNFTTTRIRPFAYGGLSAVYDITTTVTTDRTVPPSDNTFNFSMVFGIGIEAFITKEFFARADWRYEMFMQYPMLSIGYLFK